MVEHGFRPSSPVNVNKIAKKLGIKVIEAPAEDGLSGFLLREPDQQKVVIGVNSTHPPTRRRFTIAHELGHFLLHNYEGFHWERADSGTKVQFRDDLAKDGTDLDEREANLFAAELLMPEDFLRKDIEKTGPIDLLNLDQLEALAKCYRVSSQAMMYRLTNLGLIR